MLTLSLAYLQVTAPLSGDAATWVPPAGLYCENSKKHCNHNMWELKAQAMGTSPSRAEAQTMGGACLGASYRLQHG